MHLDRDPPGPPRGAQRDTRLAPASTPSTKGPASGLAKSVLHGKPRHGEGRPRQQGRERPGKAEAEHDKVLRRHARTSPEQRGEDLPRRECHRPEEHVRRKGEQKHHPEEKQKPTGPPVPCFLLLSGKEALVHGAVPPLSGRRR